jgi:uncharacterized protein YkuJ
MLLKNIEIIFLRKCRCCGVGYNYEIPSISESSNIIVEYPFEYNGKKCADVAYLEGAEIIALFECCYRHKTSEESRPPDVMWFEYDAQEVIRLANDITTTKVTINCIRDETCEECVKKIEENIKMDKERQKERKINDNE